MVKIHVPLTLDELNTFGVEPYLAELKKTDATRVFIATGTTSDDPEWQKDTLAGLKKYTALFHEAGYEVGQWMWALNRAKPNTYELRHFFGGKVAPNEVCPLDEAFLASEEAWVAKCAATGVDMIQFDDDVNVSIAWWLGLACCCPEHMKRYNAMVGEDLTPEEFAEKAFRGGKNKYRDAWQAVNRETLLNFARRMRAAVDSVNPSVRLGHCSVMSTWDMDGVSSYELAHVFAGKNKPFVRLIGAPYWGERRQLTCRPADVWNLERMELSWATEADDDIEIYAEGDVFPRPRHIVPAAHLEWFDFILRTEDRMDGILRYMIDYTSSPSYEPGYVKAYLKHADLHAAAEQWFRGKQNTGVRVYETLKKVGDATLPTDRYVGDDYMDHFFYSPASHLLNYVSLSATFKGRGTAGICFGENAKMLDEEALSGGLFLDIVAAEKLTEQGIDVGLVSAEQMEGTNDEYFVEHDEVAARYPDGCPNSQYTMVLREGAVITSSFGAGKGTTPEERRAFALTRPACYRYENAKGQRFVVFGFDGMLVNERQFRCYERQSQMIADIEWLTGKKPAAVLRGQPDFYLLTKEDETETAIAFVNISLDELYDPVIELDRTYASAEFIGCTGKLEGDRILLADLPAAAFGAIRLKK